MSSRRIPRRAWEEKKHVIMALAAKNTLKDVVKLMSQQHQFDAPLIQYEYHLKEWRAPPKYLKGGAWAKVIAAYDSLVSRHGTVRVLVNNVPLSTEQLQRKRRLYVKAASSSQSHPTGGDTSLPDVVSFQRQSADGTWLPLVPGPRSGEFDAAAAPSLEATRMDDAIPAPSPAPDLTGTAAQSLEEEEEDEEQEDANLWMTASPIGVSEPLPHGDSVSPRSRAFAFMVTRNEPRAEQSRLGSSFCSAILPRSGSPQSLAPITSLSPFDFGELDLSNHLTVQPFLGLSPPPPSPPSLFAGIDVNALAANWQAAAAAAILPEKPTGILARQLQSMFLNFEKLERHNDTWGFRPSRTESPFPSNFRGANFHPTQRRHDFGDSVPQQNRCLLLRGPLGTVGYAECLQGNVPDTDVPRSVLFALANNFAGLEHVEISEIIPWISRSKNGSSLIQQLLRDKQNPHVRAMAESLLKASIEAQSVNVFRQILASGAVDIDSVCCVEGKKYSVLGKSAALQNLSLVQAVLAFRPKIEEPVGVRNPNWSGPLGAFTCLVGSLGPFDASISSDFEKIAYLLHRAGAYIDPWDLYYLMDKGEAGTRLALSLASKVAPTQHAELIAADVLRHSITRFQNEALALRFINGIFNACYDEHRWACKHDADMREKLWDALLASAEAGYFNLAKLLLPFNSDENGSNRSAFLLASIHGGSKEVVSLALSQEPDLGHLATRPGKPMDDLTTPLAEAIRSRKEDVIRLLEEAGCLKYLHMERHFKEAITAASRTGNLACVQKLLQHCPRPRFSVINEALNVSTKAGHDEITSAPVAAGSGGDLLIAALLRNDWHAILDHRPDPQHSQRHYELLTGSGGLRSLWDNFFTHLVGSGDRQIILKAIKLFPVKTCEDTHWEVSWAKLNREVLPFLCEHKAVSRRGLTLYLREALKKQDDSMVDLAIRLGANPVDRTVLKLAVIQSPHLLPFILSRVPPPVLEFVAREVEDRSPEACTTSHAIHSALEQGLSGLPSLKSLFESGIVHMPTLHMWFESSCLVDLRRAIMAIQGDHDNFAVVRYLLDSGCDPNTHEDAHLVRFPGAYSESTALLQAVVTKYVHLVELLIQKGANVNQRTTGRIIRTPLQRAAELGSLDIVKLLLDHGADVNAPAAEWYGGTALQLAAISGNCAVACELLERGADLHMAPCKKEGRWPLEGAAEHGRMSMVELLWEHGSGIFPGSVVDRAMELAEGNGHLACKELLGSLRAKKRQLGDAASTDWMAPVF